MVFLLLTKYCVCAADDVDVALERERERHSTRLGPNTTAALDAAMNIAARSLGQPGRLRLRLLLQGGGGGRLTLQAKDNGVRERRRRRSEVLALGGAKRWRGTNPAPRSLPFRGTNPRSLPFNLS